MNKKIYIGLNITLLLWFALDMVGLSINGEVLVSRAYKDDWIFFLIYLLVFSFFLIQPKKGFYPLAIWLLMWFLSQFFSHWVFTITASGEEKMEYFSDTIKLFGATGYYIPDLYHIVLHILILSCFIGLIIYKVEERNRSNKIAK